MTPIPQQPGEYPMSRTVFEDATADDSDLDFSESPRTVTDLNSYLAGDKAAFTAAPPPPLPPFCERDDECADDKFDQRRAVDFVDGTADTTRSARKRRIRMGGLGRPSSSSFGDGGVKTYKLAYRIYRPNLMGSKDGRAPILALHGGPSLPSQYMRPLADLFPDRSVVLYDQLGCGLSSSPPDRALYSLSKSVDDLESLIASLKLRRFHLLGHSFGGALAYEYTKRLAERAGREDIGWRDDPHVLSLVLSNASTSAALSDAERARLFREMRPIPPPGGGWTSCSSCEGGSDFDDDDDDDEDIVEEIMRENEFWSIHQCRMSRTPPSLEESMEGWGVPWHESNSALSSYAASKPSRWASELPPAMVLRGEHDFVTGPCVEGWRGMWNRNRGGVDDDGDGCVSEVVLAGCAHYCHLEDGAAYGRVVGEFCRYRDPQNELLTGPLAVLKARMGRGQGWG